MYFRYQNSDTGANLNIYIYIVVEIGNTNANNLTLYNPFGICAPRHQEGNINVRS